MISPRSIPTGAPGRSRDRSTRARCAAALALALLAAGAPAAGAADTTGRATDPPVNTCCDWGSDGRGK